MEFSAHPFRDDLNEAYTPKEWTTEHVERLMVDAYRTLIALPRERHGPRAFGNHWPSYTHDWEDLLAQCEAEEKPDRFAVILTQRPTPAEIAQMEIVLGWPLSYLRGYTAEARALCARSLAKARGKKVSKLARHLQITSSELRSRSTFASRVISNSLVARGVAVIQ